MDKETVIEKIKKLLRMKRGGTPGEIENALAAAAKLGREHGIDLAKVNPDEEQSSERLSHLHAILNTRLPLEAKLAGGILTKFFNVTIIVQRCAVPLAGWVEKRWVVHVIGDEVACAIAKHVFVFLQHAFRSAWNSRENRRLRNRAAFLQGAYVGMAFKLDQERQREPNEYGLLVLNRALQRREEYLAKTFPDLQKHDFKIDRSAMAAKQAGAIAGSKIQIRRGLTSAPTPARPALPAVNPQPDLL